MEEHVNFSDWLRQNKELVDLIVEQSKLQFPTYEHDNPSNVSVNHLQISSQKAFERGAIWAFLNTDLFLAVCVEHHHKITTDSKWALENGYSVLRTVTKPIQTI
jgi:hypothetical protein